MAFPKRKTKKKAAPVEPDIDVMVGDEGGLTPFTPESIDTPSADGTSVTITFPDAVEEPKSTKFDDNLAEFVDDTTRGRLVETLLEAIEQDERDRSEWLQQRADGLDLLGNKVERPGGGNVGTSSTAVPGQSTVRDGILADACERFRANAFAELCPSEGPCKVVNFGPETADMDGLADAFEKDMNFYLTTTAREYYPDTNKMLWWTGYASGMFKKVYKCPIRNRPVSESVDGSDLIVPSNATDLHNAGRITHQINMSQATMRRMQILGAYRDISLTAPTPQPNVLQNKEADLVGMNANQQREQDQRYTVYECYTDYDLPGFEHKMAGKETGLPLPYIVTLDKDSRTVLAIRRNWNENLPEAKKFDALEDIDDDNETEGDEQLPVAKIPFVLFAYSLGLGFYGTGLLHKLGNYAMALTAMLRLCIDAGMFASFPGFLFAKPMGRQLQNEFRVPPGGGAPIDVSAVGGDINKAVMPLPYKDVSGALVALAQQTRENASRIGGTAEAPTGEGVVNAPVGSVLAAIDQATRVEGGVHKMLYAAQKEELGLLKELFRDDPEALWRDNKRPAMGADKASRLALFKRALENCDLVPASDPNVPSHMHRLAKANTYLQTAMALPGEFILQNVIRRWAAMVKIDDVDKDFAPPQPQQPNPAVLKLTIDKQNADTRAADVAAKTEIAHAEIQSKEQIEAAKLGQAHAAGLRAPGQSVKESLSYKDAPPDIQRQIEQQAGLVPSQMPAQDESQPDPMQAQAMALQATKVQQSGHKMVIDAHNAHAERQNKLDLKAFDIGARLATHPESQPVVNSELQALSPFMGAPDAAAASPPMSDGGKVPATNEQRLAKVLAAFLRDNSLQTKYPN